MATVTLRGTVVRGDGRGRQLGFPTANVQPVEGAPPENGVYAVEIEGDFGKRMGICNVGVRPTIEGSEGVHVEVHIPGFSDDLYGQTLTVRFFRRIRGEQKFASLDELKAQIQKDVTSIE